MASITANKTLREQRFNTRTRRAVDTCQARLLLLLVSALAIALASGCSADGELTEASEADSAIPASGAPLSETGGVGAASPTVIEVREPGVEPFIDISVALPSDATVHVSARSNDSGQVGDDTFERVRSLSYDLATTTEVDGDVHRVALAPRITAIEPAIPIADDDRIDGWNWTIAPNGLVISNKTPWLTDPRLREISALLAAPELFAAVPTTPVGIGARWAYSSNANGEGMVEAELLSIDETTIEIAYALFVELDEGTIDLAWSGSYNRTTLMATNVTSTSVFEFASETTTNGVVVPVLGLYQVERSIVEGDQ